MARLGEICAINMGQSPDSSTYNKDRNGLPFFQGNADFGEVYLMVRLWCSEPIKIAQEKDILISVRAPIGALNISNCKCCIGRGLAALTVNKNICIREYLWHALLSKITELNSKGTGSTFKAINKKTLTETEIPLPSLDEQQKIAAVLDKVNDLINKRRQQLDKLDELVKSWFVEMFGKLGSNPKGYPSKTLAELCSKITDGKHGGCETEAGTGRFFVGAREIYDGVVHYDTAPEITVRDFEKDYKRCNIEIGDFLIVNTGATIGKSAIATDERTTSTLLQKSVALLKVRSEQMLPIFLRYCYMANPKMYMVESASAQPNLLLSKIKATTVYVPPIDQQQAFAAFVHQIDKSKSAIQKSLKKLETLKKSLMQEYFG
ncbi:MAG: restriction endonuclease subunit S [Lachnospiraceae bacterium]|nr:restriction endonuclease subunit S [Lachnospiraceae bacterium]